MRVAIVNLTAGGLSGGYVKYLRRLVPRLRSHPAIASLAVYVPDAARALLKDEGATVWSVAEARRGFRRLKETVLAGRPDVIFIPTASWLNFGTTPVVVMVRNMEPLEVPFGGNSAREALRNLGRRTMARRACRRAARVIAVSNHVRQFLVSRWGIPASKVPVVYHGADSVTDAPASAGAGPAALGGDVHEEFLFTAGSIRPARGLDDLVEVLPRLAAEGLTARVVVAGRADRGTVAYQQRLIARARQLRVGERIVWAGSLAEAEMRWCFERCKAFVMTSRAEACPNVALEAMSHRCACVSVDRAPMPEFFGDAAIYYPAGDAASLARAIASLKPAATREALAAAAAARSRAFDWDTTAERTVAALGAVVRS